MELRSLGRVALHGALLLVRLLLREFRHVPRRQLLRSMEFPAQRFFG